MARKLRSEEAGGLYHVLNRGNFRSWIFESDKAKEAFAKAVFEACSRAGWVLHAYAIMGNHYHLALETPRENLSEGMRWLQSVFANRFNRFHGAGGHLFQGRFKSLVVENFQHLANVCHYIHLNPVRAGLCNVEQLAEYPWTSLHYLNRPKDRPAFLQFATCLNGAGELADTQQGREKHLAYLAWLSTDEGAQKELAFEKMSRGWAIGSQEFTRASALDEKLKQSLVQLTAMETQMAREARWTEVLDACLKLSGHTTERIHESPKAADWKVAIATVLKVKEMARNGWIAEKLGMGTLTGVSRYTSECLRGERSEAARIYEDITARLKL